MEFSSYVIFFFILYNSAAFMPSFSSSFIKHRCHDDERSALLQFKNSFFSTNSCMEHFDFLKGVDDIFGYSKVESWKLVDGKGSGDCCKWDGVECDNRTNHVIGLNLSDSCISASINSNSTLFDLVHLQSLNLAYNDFHHSQIPSRIGELSSLTYLNLTHSGFSGQIPAQLLNLSNLVSLDLYSCDLEGEFPTAIFQLPNLKILDLSWNTNLKINLPNFEFGGPLKSLKLYQTNMNNLDEGNSLVVPISIRNLIYMEELELSGCTFTPSSIENLVHLRFLTIEGCIFTGQIPPSFSNFTKLECLRFFANDLGIYTQTTSSFTWIGELTKLTHLSLRRIKMNGEMPSFWFMNLTRLSYLDMYGNQLRGPLPQALMNLTQLSSLDISSNQLTGPLPLNFMSLTQLYCLAMSDNQLTGSLPLGLMNLTQLEEINLSHNQLSSQIPFQIGNLTSLSLLDLSFNQLRGEIPTSFSHLNNLQLIDLSSNELIGTLDLTVFYPLRNLRILDLSNNNNFSFVTETKSNVSFKSITKLGLGSCNLSEFPSFLHNKLDSLSNLDLSSNNFYGQIPSWTGLQSLQSLNLSHNHLTGFDKDSTILQWPQLLNLDLTYNMLQGYLPMPPSLTRIYLVSNNNMSGELSPSICSLNHLEMLNLSFNKFSGKLPQCLANLSDSLTLLDLKANSFHGSIPSMWINECNLKMISMSHNQLQGGLPGSLVNCSSLEMVDFGSNQIVDAFPFWLGSLPNLEILILRSNGFYGTMENSVAIGFSSLRVIDLSHNHFSGKIPLKLLRNWNAMKLRNTSYMGYMEDYATVYAAYSDFGHYDYSMTLHNKGLEMNYMKIPYILVAIDFSNNKFQGEVPDMIGNLNGLQLLNFSRNILQGPIPSSLANLKALECLDLSSNQLSGQIPTKLTEITALSSFDVSFNQLSGPIPQGNQFCNFESKSYEGNPRLWVDTWTKQCGNFKSAPGFVPPSFTEEASTDSEFKINWIVVSMGYASGIVVGVIAGNEFARRKQHWFAKRIKKKNRRQSKRRLRN